MLLLLCFYFACPLFLFSPPLAFLSCFCFTAIFQITSPFSFTFPSSHILPDFHVSSSAEITISSASDSESLCQHLIRHSGAGMGLHSQEVTGSQALPLPPGPLAPQAPSLLHRCLVLPAVSLPLIPDFVSPLFRPLLKCCAYNTRQR